MTREEIRQDLGDDKYLNSFKARRYIEFLLAECDELEKTLAASRARAEREHAWALAWADTAEGLGKELKKIRQRGKEK